MLTFDAERQPRRNNNHPTATPRVVGRTMVVNMKADTENIKLRVQTTLDDLIREHLIPFKLTAYGVNAAGPGKYIVPFHDSRIHSFEFSWIDGRGLSFKDIVRSAVLKRVQRMDGPPHGWPA
jgi:hypothetical protein